MKMAQLPITSLVLIGVAVTGATNWQAPQATVTTTIQQTISGSENSTAQDGTEEHAASSRNMVY